MDHIANTNLFPNAKIYLKFSKSPYPGQLQDPKEGTLQRIDIIEGKEIAAGVKVIELAGHSADLAGLLIETEKGNVVIASDAISNEAWTDITRKPDEILTYSIIEYDKSRKKILELADWIIPGHGNIFKVKR